jgi:hypothetical protein
VRWLAVTQVECVKGCGESFAVIALAVASVIASVVAVVLAYRAWKTSVEQRDMQRVEHNALLEELSAYALLDVDVSLMGDDSRDQQVESSRFAKVIAVTINNRQGKKPATSVTVNVIVPRHAEVRWSDAHGGQHQARSGAPSPTEEPLRAGDQDVAAHYLDAIIGPIPTSLDAMMLYVRADLDIGVIKALDPSQHEPAELLLPVKIDVSCDDLPPGRKSIIVERSWRFWRAPVQG